MYSNVLLFHLRNFSPSEAKHIFSWNSFRQRCLLHTSLRVSNLEKVMNNKVPDKIDGYHEVPHMRVKSESKDNEIDIQKYTMQHQIYSEEELNAVKITHRKIETWHDRLAYAAVRTLRFVFDNLTGYVHEPLDIHEEKRNRRPRKRMTEARWLRRFIFLESIAGVPGMVAGMSRHMRSLRSMKRDNGWIHTLLSEAENERMHLLTFLELRNPGRIFHVLVLLAQGVFFNGFFISYLISPKFCHRFVGFLEEEAVITYTQCIKQLDAGLLPVWSKTPAPKIAKSYWRLPDNALMRDVLLAVRADEATHRQVNHKFADVDSDAPNPLLSRQKGEREPFDEEEQKEIDTARKT